MIAWNFLLCLKLLLGWTGKKTSFLLCFYRQRFLLNNVTFHDSKLSMFSWHSRSIYVLYLNTGNSRAETIEAKSCKNNSEQIWNIHRAATPSSGIALVEIQGNLELGKPETCLVLCNRYCKKRSAPFYKLGSLVNNRLEKIGHQEQMINIWRPVPIDTTVFCLFCQNMCWNLLPLINFVSNMFVDPVQPRQSLSSPPELEFRPPAEQWWAVAATADCCSSSGPPSCFYLLTYM